MKTRIKSRFGEIIIVREEAASHRETQVAHVLVVVPARKHPKLDVDALDVFDVASIRQKRVSMKTHVYFRFSENVREFFSRVLSL